VDHDNLANGWEANALVANSINIGAAKAVLGVKFDISKKKARRSGRRMMVRISCLFNWHLIYLIKLIQSNRGVAIRY